MWIYVILSAALVSTIVFIVYDWRKINKPAAGGRSKAAQDKTENLGISAELTYIYKAFASKLSSKFEHISESTYHNASTAAPALLFVVSRLFLISNGIMSHPSSKASLQIDRTVYKLLSSENHSGIFDAYLKYFQTFLPPSNALPRCDMFMGSKDVFNGSGNLPLLRLCVAYGDCIVNPSLITHGANAPFVLSSIFETQEIAAVIMREMLPLIDDFAYRLTQHFSRRKSFYQI